MFDDDLRPVQPGVRRHRRACPAGPVPGRVLQGRGQDGGDVRERRRGPLLGAGRLAPGDGPTGSIRVLGRGSVVINTGRREGLSGGGRGGAQDPSGGARRGRGWRSRRTVRRGGGRRGVHLGRPRALLPSRSSLTTSRGAWPTSRRHGGCGRLKPSVARPRGKLTTAVTARGCGVGGLPLPIATPVLGTTPGVYEHKTA